jgi:hypothetical protein
VNSNIAIGSLPTHQISPGIVALFAKIFDGKPILTVFSNIGEDVQCRCLNLVYNVERVSQHGTIVLLGNDYNFQIIETGFAEQF